MPTSTMSIPPSKSGKTRRRLARRLVGRQVCRLGGRVVPLHWSPSTGTLSKHRDRNRRPPGHRPPVTRRTRAIASPSPVGPHGHGHNIRRGPLDLGPLCLAVCRGAARPPSRSDCPRTLVDLLKQRKRRVNGSLFSRLHAIRGAPRLYWTRHLPILAKAALSVHLLLVLVLGTLQLLAPGLYFGVLTIVVLGLCCWPPGAME